MSVHPILDLIRDHDVKQAKGFRAAADPANPRTDFRTIHPRCLDESDETVHNII